MHVNLGGIGIGVAHEVLAYAGTDVAFFQLGAEQVADGMGVQLGGVDAGQLAVFTHHFKRFNSQPPEGGWARYADGCAT